MDDSWDVGFTNYDFGADILTDASDLDSKNACVQSDGYGTVARSGLYFAQPLAGSSRCVDRTYQRDVPGYGVVKR
jgi:hypothetical protein